MRSIIISTLLIVGSLMIVQAAANLLQTWQGRRHVDYQALIPEDEPVFIRKASADTRTLHRPARPVPAVERVAAQ